MKKVLTILAVAAALAAVSCTKELERSAADSSTVTFTVDAGQISTRAVSGTHGTATRLQVGVYLKGTGESYSYIEAISQEETVTAWPTVVSLELARNETYKIVFWADEGENAYTIDWTNGTVAETATTIAGNATDRDAYYKLVEITPSGSTGESITLVRPLAQVNVGTNDLAAYKLAADYDGNIEAQVVINGVAPGINLLTGEAVAGEPVNLTFSYADNMDPTLVSGGSNFSYLGMNYILCPADNTLTAQIALRKDDAAENINSFTVSNMPVKPNYRTNVVGKLLTGTVEYTVDVDTDFNSDLEKQVGPTFESVTALNAYFATMADNSDHGDINPEVVTVTAIAGGETIVLPAIAGDVVIRIPAILETGTLYIAYAASGDKPANVSLYVKQLKKLVANITSSHFTLISGSHITDTAEVYTSSTTFVIEEGAKVGTVEIKQGNANIAGAVATISVPAEASADGAGAPVQVFLEKEAAVEQINLAAPSDVVVEQPAENIDVEETEKKVCVNVAASASGSTAMAQNGGQIYVKIEGTTDPENPVECTLTADGTSTVEEGSIPSGITIAEVGSNADVSAIESQGGDVSVSEGVAEGAVDVKEGVAKIDKTVYPSLAEAVAAVPDETPTTIVMIGDDAVENGITIAAGKIIVLELAGHTVSGNTNSANTYALITNRGTLTIQDNTDTNKDGTGTGLLTTYITNADQQDVPGYASNTITNNGTLTVKSGKLVNNGNGYACYAIDNQTNGTLYNPVLRIEGGCMEQMREYTYAVRMICNSQTNTNTVEVTGGVIQGGYGFWLQMPSQNSAPDASLTISGGTIISRDGAAAYIASSYNATTSRENVTVNISGGTFTGSTYGLMVQGVADGYAGFKEFDISGGIISGIAAGKNLGGFISGGYFGNDPTDFLKAGLEANLDSDGWWNVGPAVWSGAVASDEQFNASVDETAKTVTVSSTAVLAKLAANVQAGNDYAGYKITLTKDMDLNNQEWTPIGGGAIDSKASGKNFAGEFDGGGHTISNLKISRGYSDVDLNWRVGFIGSAIGAKVHDLTIHNANVTARGEVAAAVGYNAYSVEGKPSEIYNVNVTGHVVISAAHRGAAAICGYSNYYIHDCTVNVDSTSLIDGFWASGGIVGFSPQSGDIKNNYSNIKVVSDYACGGIVGLIEDSVEISGNTVENTTLQASADYGIGGLIGMMNFGTGLKIKNNTVSNVAINATENVAGVIGAVWEDWAGGTGAVEITNNTITGITINSSKGDGTAAFIGFMDPAQTATISGNSIQGTINTAKALVNDGIWAGVTDASNVVASNNTMNLEINVAE